MENNNLKFWKIAVAVLILLNLVVLIFVSVNKNFRGNHHRECVEQMPPQHGGENPGEFLCRELKFSDGQRKQFEALRNQHHEAIDSLEDINRDLHDKYFDLLHDENIDEQKVSAIAQQIADIQKAKEIITFHHFATLKKMCDAEQKKHFDDIIQEVLRIMHRGQNQPPPPNHL